MVWSRRDSRRRQQEARHRWDALFSDVSGPGEGLLELAADTAPIPVVQEPSRVMDREADLRAAAETGGEAEPDARTSTASRAGAGAGASSAVDSDAVSTDQISDSGARGRSSRPRFAVSVRLAAVVTMLLSATCGAWWWFSESAGPDVRPVADAGAAEAHRAAGSAASTQTGTAPPSGPGATRAGGGPTVHVVGAVSAPGVYHLAPGARVYEAIAAAGGATAGAETNRLNLAATVEDGTRIKIPSLDDPEAPESAGTSQAGAAPGGAVASATGGRVNINTAAAAELATLPRVGPVLAQRIVDFRTAHGRFTEPEGLDAVSGIGPKMLESLLPMVTVQ